MKYLFTLIAAALLLIAGCASAPPVPPKENAKAALEFIDLDAFDRDLFASLANGLPSVNVAFMQGASPSAIPERMNKWLHAVEEGQGKVTVTPAQSSVTTKNPFLLLTLISGIWNSHKASEAIKTHELHKPAQAYNAEVSLKADAQGNRVIDRITLTKRLAP